MVAGQRSEHRMEVEIAAQGLEDVVVVLGVLGLAAITDLAAYAGGGFTR